MEITDSRFLQAWKDLLAAEGSAFNPNDPGGGSRYGITKKWHQDVDVVNLSEEDVKAIYYQEYWTDLRYREIGFLPVASKLMNFAANMGFKRAHSLLQRALNFTYADSPAEVLEVDGILGGMTIEAINHHPNGWWLLDRFKLLALGYYHFLNRPADLPSWVRRVLL